MQPLNITGRIPSTRRPAAPAHILASVAVTPHRQPLPASLGRLQFAVPIQVIPPALVQVIGGEMTAICLELAGPGLMRRRQGNHAAFPGQTAALAQITGGARCDHILPSGPPPPAAGDDVIEGQILGGKPNAAILAAKPVTQENIIPGEYGSAISKNKLFQRDDRRQSHFQPRRPDNPVITGNNAHPLQKDRLDGVLPRPQRQREITQRPKIGIEDQRRTMVGMRWQAPISREFQQPPEGNPFGAGRPAGSTRMSGFPRCLYQQARKHNSLSMIVS